MRQSHAAVLERYTVFDGQFATEPHEVGWAAEARWFVHVLNAAQPDTRLILASQVSPDGLTWCDADTSKHVAVGEGLISWPVREFGQWLRLSGAVEGDGDFVKVLIYLTLKS